MDTRFADTLLVLLSSINEKCQCVEKTGWSLPPPPPLPTILRTFSRAVSKLNLLLIRIFDGISFWSSSQQFINTRPIRRLRHTLCIEWMDWSRRILVPFSLPPSSVGDFCIDYTMWSVLRRTNMPNGTRSRRNENLKWLHWHCQLRSNRIEINPPNLCDFIKNQQREEKNVLDFHFRQAKIYIFINYANFPSGAKSNTHQHLLN